MKLLKLFSLSIITVLLTGCENNPTVFHRYQAIPIQGWKRKDPLSFTIPDTLTGNRYELEIGLRHTEMYPYRDLWIALIHPLDSFPPDTFHVELASSKGDWKGKGNAGSLYQYALSVGNITLTSADTLLQLVQVMKDSCLQGITDAGIRLSFTSRINTQKDKQQDSKSPKR